MNYPVLKDVKAMAGFILSLILSVIAIALALSNSSYWVLFIVISLIVLAVSVFRADRLYKQKGR